MTSILYTRDHEWIKKDENGFFTVGISDYAQKKMGDVVFVDLPKQGALLRAGDSCAVVESVKAASDIYAPIAGEVSAVNPRLDSDPGIVNADPEGEGWFFKLQRKDPSDLETLMTREEYEAYLCNGEL